MEFKTKLGNIVQKRAELSDLLIRNEFKSSNEYQETAKEFSKIEVIADKAANYLKLEKDIQELDQLYTDDSTDQDTKEMILAEKDSLNAEIAKAYDEMSILLLPKDEADQKGAILEIRAGTGGDEAALFAADLFQMYRNYTEEKGWKFEILSISETGIDGYKEASASISGYGVFERMKFESGVHRVQRIPATESNGRIHTSAATVAVLPEAEEIDVELRDEDLRIDTYRASGAGGQHVNTTDSAIRVTHIPSGIVVCQQDEKSQHKNKAKALKILRSRIYDARRSAEAQKRSSARKSMVGSGDRSERIRTYNYPQGRVTDHRINVTSYNLDGVIQGSASQLDQFIDVLIAEDNASKMSS